MKLFIEFTTRRKVAYGTGMKIPRPRIYTTITVYTKERVEPYK